MALIECPDCGKNISDMATSCIHCGRPMNHINSKTNTKRQNESSESQAITEDYSKKTLAYSGPCIIAKEIKLDSDCFYYASDRYNYENVTGLYYKAESVMTGFVTRKSASIKLRMEDNRVLKVSAGGAFEKKNVEKISDAYRVLRRVTLPRRLEYYLEQLHKKGFIEYKYGAKLTEVGVWSAVKTPTSVRIFAEGYVEKGGKTYDLKTAKQNGILSFGMDWEFGFNNNYDPTQIIIAEKKVKHLMQFRTLRINAVWDTDIIHGIVKVLSEGKSLL